MFVKGENTGREKEEVCGVVKAVYRGVTFYFCSTEALEDFIRKYGIRRSEIKLVVEVSGETINEGVI